MLKRMTIAMTIMMSFAMMGCEKIPQPMGLIEAPALAAAAQVSPKDADIIKISRSFLPKGGQFAAAAEPKGVKPVVSVDIDQDGVSEIFATYRPTAQSNVVHGMMLQKKSGKWQRILVVDEPIKYVSMDNIAPGKSLEVLLGIGPQWSETNILRSYWLKGGKLEKLTDLPYTHFSLWTEGKAVEKRIALFNKVRGIVDFFDFPTLTVFYFEKQEDYLIMKSSPAGYKQYVGEYLKEIEAIDKENPGNPVIQMSIAEVHLLLGRLEEAHRLLSIIQPEPESFFEIKRLQQNWFEYYYQKKDFESAETAMKNVYRLNDEYFVGRDETVNQMKEWSIYTWVLNHTEAQAKTLVALGKREEAVQLYENNMALIERNRIRHESMSLNSLKTSYFTGITLLGDSNMTTKRLGEWQKALAELRK